MHDLIVIGAGPGGYEAAAHGARLGGKVALVEKERLGGTCLNAGCIPAKTFLRSSKLYQECRESNAYGVRIGALEFDLPAVIERKNRVVGTLTNGVAGMLKRAGVEMIPGHGRLAGRGGVDIGGTRHETRNILIATGSRPAVPPIPGIGSERVLDSNTIFAIPSIPESIAIIGGGYIGLEFACFFSEIGSRVSVFEMLPQIATGSDQDISGNLLKTLTRKGVEFKLSSRVLEIEGGTLHFATNDGGRASATADYILNATG